MHINKLVNEGAIGNLVGNFTDVVKSVASEFVDQTTDEIKEKNKRDYGSIYKDGEIINAANAKNKDLGQKARIKNAEVAQSYMNKDAGSYAVFDLVVKSLKNQKDIKCDYFYPSNLIIATIDDVNNLGTNTEKYPDNEAGKEKREKLIKTFLKDGDYHKYVMDFRSPSLFLLFLADEDVINQIQSQNNNNEEGQNQNNNNDQNIQDDEDYSADSFWEGYHRKKTSLRHESLDLSDKFIKRLYQKANLQARKDFNDNQEISDYQTFLYDIDIDPFEEDEIDFSTKSELYKTYQRRYREIERDDNIYIPDTDGEYLVFEDDVLNYSGSLDQCKDYIERVEDEYMEFGDVATMPWFKVKRNPNYSNSLEEKIVHKKNGKWVNKGKDGTEHGEFRTKKAAKAQLRAMYASGYKGESVRRLKENFFKDLMLLAEDLADEDETPRSFEEFANTVDSKYNYVDDGLMNQLYDEYLKFFNKYSELDTIDVDYLIDDLIGHHGYGMESPEIISFTNLCDISTDVDEILERYQDLVDNAFKFDEEDDEDEVDESYEFEAEDSDSCEEDDKSQVDDSDDSDEILTEDNEESDDVDDSDEIEKTMDEINSSDPSSNNEDKEKETKTDEKLDDKKEILNELSEGYETTVDDVIEGSINNSSDGQIDSDLKLFNKLSRMFKTNSDNIQVYVLDDGSEDFTCYSDLTVEDVTKIDDRTKLYRINNSIEVAREVLNGNIYLYFKNQDDLKKYKSLVSTLEESVEQDLYKMTSNALDALNNLDKNEDDKVVDSIDKAIDNGEDAKDEIKKN